ncbi:MAG: hypothetical protein ACK40X_09340 [Armatimonadota bacterium]
MIYFRGKILGHFRQAKGSEVLKQFLFLAVVAGRVRLLPNPISKNGTRDARRGTDFGKSASR